jgi:SAM-dependent methyltransferase
MNDSLIDLDLVHADAMLPQAVRWVEPSTREIAERLLDTAALPTGARVLDVGAGTGPLLAAAAERGLEVVGIDNAPLTTTYLTGRAAQYPLATAKLADATALPFAPESFDAAFSVFAIMYAGPAALAELLRVVRPGGTVAIVHWAEPTMAPYIKLLWEEGPELAANLPHLGREEFAATLTAAGFTEVRVEPVSAGYALPPADEYLLELQSFVTTLPAFRTMSPGRRAELDSALAARVRRIETGQEPRPAFNANVAWARV